jgi:hypothetical protein
MHEFAEVPDEGVTRTLDGDVRKAAEEGTWGATESEMLIWRLDRAHGDNKIFDE